MRIIATSPEIGIKKGAECYVVAIWNFENRTQPWFFFVDDGNVCVSVSASDVDICDPSLDGYKFVQGSEFKSGYSIVIDILAEDSELFERLLNCDPSAHREFNLLRSNSLAEG